ncbi:PAS domain S-box protein, partial [Candidatus Gracilibacteria bacterium]|nr:PAS domain S-box protein [Candidatus Gracilibacteria bacterium]
MLLLLEDITERERLSAEVRKAEQHLASVAESANDAVVSLDQHGRIVTWNSAAERISGFAAVDVVGRALSDLCADAQRPHFLAMFHALITGNTAQQIEVDLITAQGRVVPIAWSGALMRDEVGKLSAFVVVGRDLTDRR